MLDLEASYVWLKELIVSPDMIFHGLIIASSPKFIYPIYPNGRDT
jgi:hypothetical protein